MCAARGSLKYHLPSFSSRARLCSAGHLPLSRENVGKSPVGGVQKFVDADKPYGQPFRYTSKQEPPPDQVSFMSKDLEVRHVRQHLEYKQRVEGIVPGYAGFVPGANHKYGASPFGGVPMFASK